MGIYKTAHCEVPKMIKQSGETYLSAKHGKDLFVSVPKDGKTCFLVASALGVLPWQNHGGLVDRPEHLHILSFDSSAVAGVPEFLTKTCNAPKEALKFNVYNFQDDARRVSMGDTEYDYSLYNGILGVVQELEVIAKKGGVHVVLVSSLTGMAQAIQRGIAGPPGQSTAGGSVKKGSGMDQSKWTTFAAQMNELRNFLQIDLWHTQWEAHIHKPNQTGQSKDDGVTAKETLQIQGQTGQNFAYNVEHVYRIRRQYGMKYKETKCEQMYLDTTPALDFVANGRGFTENLNPKEYDLTSACKKLGLRVGGWGAKAAVPKPIAKPAAVAVRR
jgi:hypothetical protein